MSEGIAAIAPMVRVRGTIDLKSLGSASSMTENVRAHYEHLEKLAASLRQIGMDEQTIDEHVIALFENYKAELRKAIAGL